LSRRRRRFVLAVRSTLIAIIVIAGCGALALRDPATLAGCPLWMTRSHIRPLISEEAALVRGASHTESR